MTFNTMCNHIAAMRCLQAGQSLQQVAKSARRSPSTIRRWAAATGLIWIKGKPTKESSTYEET